jgi:hypothetical protein
MRAWLARQRERGEKPKPPSAEEMKDAVGPTPPDKEPGAPTADPRARQATQPLTPVPTAAFAQKADARASDYLIGAGIVVAQVWFTLKSFGKRTRGA